MEPRTRSPELREVDSGQAAKLLRDLSAFGPILAVKLYRIRLEPSPDVPVLPCLDHEAMLHEGVAPHVAAYVQDGSSGDIHELVFIPARRRIEVDTVSTWGECSPESHRRLLTAIATRFPGYTTRIDGPSWWRGERRVAAACRAQVTLRNVLLGTDMASVKSGVERLQTIGALMEKQSRVASWGVRTVTGPLLTAAGVGVYLVLGSLGSHLGENSVNTLRYALIGLLGAYFLYYGLKAVQLTEMSNRVWKRTAEYNLILSERKRLGK
jgi:hypothetical protein